MTKGDSGQINATTVPSGVGLAWASSNDAVATVDSTGAVTAVDVGEAVITASFEYEGQTYSDTCDVTVENGPGVVINPSTLTMTQGDTYQLEAITTPEGVPVTFSCEIGIDKVEVTVDGLVTAWGTGDAQIICEMPYEGEIYMAYCDVTVESGIQPSIELDHETLDMTLLEGSDLVATTIPEGQPVTFSIEGDPAVSVNQTGHVIAIAGGVCKIVASMEFEGQVYTAECRCDVRSLSMTRSEYWTDAEKWISQQYTDDSRKTFIRYNDAEIFPKIELVYNPAGSQSTIYADLRPSMEGIEIDETDNFVLIVNYRNHSSMPIEISLTNADVNAFSAGGEKFLLPDDEDSFDIPLTYIGGTERLFTLQAKNLGATFNDETTAAIELDIVRHV